MSLVKHDADDSLHGCGMLGGLSFVFVGPMSTSLAQAKWVSRCPRASVALWQALGLSATVAAIGAGLCVATERFHAGFVGGIDDLIDGALGAHPLRGLGLPDALGLTLAADLGVVLISVMGVAMVRTILARARRRRLLTLLGSPSSGGGATVVLDHSAAVAYCLPGIRPRIVISAGTRQLLAEAELVAVIDHERGHAHGRHGMVMLPMTGLRDLFGWVPYARLAPRAIADLLEMAADDHAARHHDPASLASALVSLATFAAAEPPGCAFGVASMAVRQRVDRLIGEDRVSKGRATATGLLAALVVGAPVAVLLIS